MDTGFKGGSMGDAPIVFVVGLQKSGTTLLLRLLMSTSTFRNPVKFEGKDLWGQDRGFSPTGYPVGHVYQRHEGRAGHVIGAEDATEEIADHLRRGLGEAAFGDEALVLKSPFNSVRVPWLRAMFPEATIVAVIRRPLPNVFSLRKKFTPSRFLRQGPVDGWWGVKPADWRELVQDDKLLQCAWQWRRINETLWNERDQIDQFIAYHDLCADPQSIIANLAQRTVGKAPEMDFPPISVLDDEYLHGGSLESANRTYGRTKTLDVTKATRPDERPADVLPALTEAEQAAVLEICGPTAAMLGLDADERSDAG